MTYTHGQSRDDVFGLAFMEATVGVALRGHPFPSMFQTTGGHGGPPLQLRQRFE